ncbi:helix-turn-helix domain-containing protein [Streptomyces sp. NPDC002577]
MDRIELGRVLRARRQEAGRTIASVAIDAGLSVPYIANLENGRGNPTMAALQQLAAALGTRLELDLTSDSHSTKEPEVPDTVQTLMTSPRTHAVAQRLAKETRTHTSLVMKRLQTAVLALSAVTGDDLTARDMDRLLDLLLLSRPSFKNEE